MVTIPLFAALGQTIIKLLLGGVAIFLILLVLVQRGRGGGLAGALGGMGGSSAFGAKAGDVFTRITIGAAAVWILLCIVAARMGPSEESLINTGGGQSASSPADEVPEIISADADDQATDEAGTADSADNAVPEKTAAPSSDATGNDSSSSDSSSNDQGPEK